MRMRYFAVVLYAATSTVCANAGVLKLPQDIEFKGPLSRMSRKGLRRCEPRPGASAVGLSNRLRT
jgi:hypothetical protein